MPTTDSNIVYLCIFVGLFGAFFVGKHVGDNPDLATHDMSLRGPTAGANTDHNKVYVVSSGVFDLLKDKDVGEFMLDGTNKPVSSADDGTVQAMPGKKAVADHSDQVVVSDTPSPEAMIVKHFQSQSCIKSDHEPEQWMKQMFILLGVQKGGTKAIHTFLEEHPQFVARCNIESATMEQNWFNYEVQQHHDPPGIPQAQYQQDYAKHLKTNCPLAVENLEKDPKAMYLDDSPLYLQDSDTVPALMACVTPWAKTISILRNPTDRAYSHYNFYLDRDWCTDHTFEEYVDMNIHELEKAGVTAATNVWEEFQAWQNYNEMIRNRRKCNTFVTRGLYAIQVLHYQKALEAAGRAGNLMVIHSNDLKGDDRQSTYNDMLNFLELEPHTLEHGPSVHKTVYGHSMSDSVREKLDAFYKPYNERLYTMLDWDPVWAKA